MMSLLKIHVCECRRKLPVTTTTMNDFELLLGPNYRFSDHKEGERISYRADDGATVAGEILHVSPPGPVVEGGKQGLTPGSNMCI